MATTTFDKPVGTEIKQLNDQIATMQSDLYTSEAYVGYYNGNKLYRRIFTSTVNNPAMDTAIELSSWSAPTPASVKIVSCNAIFYLGISYIDFTSNLARVYIDRSNEKIYLKQSVSSLLPYIVVKLDMLYMH